MELVSIFCFRTTPVVGVLVPVSSNIHSKMVTLCMQQYLLLHSSWYSAYCTWCSTGLHKISCTVCAYFVLQVLEYMYSVDMLRFAYHMKYAYVSYIIQYLVRGLQVISLQYTVLLVLEYWYYSTSVLVLYVQTIDCYGDWRRHVREPDEGCPRLSWPIICSHLVQQHAQHKSTFHQSHDVMKPSTDN